MIYAIDLFGINSFKCCSDIPEQFAVDSKIRSQDLRKFEIIIRYCKVVLCICCSISRTVSINIWIECNTSCFHERTKINTIVTGLVADPNKRRGTCKNTSSTSDLSFLVAGYIPVKSKSWRPEYRSLWTF